MSSKSFIGLALVGMALSPAFLEGCSSTASNPLCCTEFQVGATVDANIGGSAQSKVAVQAIADVAGIASAAIADLTTACMGIAQDLGAAQADQDAAAANTDAGAKMTAWCKLAVTAIGTAKAQASFTLNAKPPVCEASVSAKLDCQAQCSGGVKCDIKANPPKCTGGTLVVDCKGSCTANVSGGSVSCEGGCDATCTGSCTAQGGVDCTGKCEGTCTAKAGVGNGNGAQADGTCQGTCSGTCSVVAPSAKCTGSCSGKCSGTCKATSPSASVQCDGKCDVDAKPLSCSGGKLEGGCQADAKCEGNCNGSVQAKAQCTPPSIELKFAASANADFAGKLEGTLKANLPIILSLKSKFTAVADFTGTISANASAVTDIKAACLIPLGAAALQAGKDMAASVEAAGNITVAVGAG